MTPLSLFFFVEGLSPRYLSPYGCTWTDHPALNGLAADSVVFENAVADTVDSMEALSAILSLLHSNSQMSPAAGNDCITGFSENLILVTDSPSIAASSEITFRFSEVITLPRPDEPGLDGKLAHDVSGTHLASCFARVISILDTNSLPATILVHLSSLTRIWDAPFELRERYREDGDPEPSADSRPPQKLLQPDESRLEEILGITHSIAAQVDVLDVCLGTLFHELRTAGLYEDSLLLLTAPFAIPAGHHGVVDLVPGHLASDVLDVPLFIKLPGSKGSMAWRDHGLIQPSMIFPLLSSVCTDGFIDSKKLFSRTAPVAVRSTGGDQTAVRTDAWLLASIDGVPRLFTKPDDRWDVNPVEDRCRDIADAMNLLRNDLDSGN